MFDGSQMCSLVLHEHASPANLAPGILRNWLAWRVFLVEDALVVVVHLEGRRLPHGNVVSWHAAVKHVVHIGFHVG